VRATRPRDAVGASLPAACPWQEAQAQLPEQYDTQRVPGTVRFSGHLLRKNPR